MLFKFLSKNGILVKAFKEKLKRLILINQCVQLDKDYLTSKINFTALLISTALSKVGSFQPDSKVQKSKTTSKRQHEAEKGAKNQLVFKKTSKRYAIFNCLDNPFINQKLFGEKVKYCRAAIFFENYNKCKPSIIPIQIQNFNHSQKNNNSTNKRYSNTSISSNALLSFSMA